MTIRPKWLKDICSVLFGAYYLIWASEGDEVVGRRVSSGTGVLTYPSAS